MTASALLLFTVPISLILNDIPSASAQRADMAALRALVPPPRRTLAPRMVLTIGMAFLGPQGYGFYWEGRTFPAEIARLQQQANHASSIERMALYRQIGEIYKAQGESAQAQKAIDTSLSLFARQRKQAAGSDRKGRLLAEYALALEQTGQIARAEEQARTAVALAPRSWQVWAAAGQIQTNRARTMTAAVRPTTASDSAASNQAPSAPALQPVVPAGKQGAAASADAAWKEAGRDFDTAVRLAPGLPQPYEQRAAFRSAHAFAVHSSKASSIAGLSDFARAVALRPHDPYALAVLAWLDYSDYGMRYYPGQSYDNFAIWKVLPQANRRRLLGIRRHVTRLTVSRDPLLRARACTALAWLEYEFHDVPVSQARAHLQQALQAQPDFPEAELYLMHTYAVEEEWGALARFSAERGQRHPDVRHHLIAAYACYKGDRSAEAAVQTSAAVELKPDDPAANLFLAFLLLRSGGQDKVEEAGRRLDAADANLAAPGSSASDVKASQEESAVLRGFYFALNGKQEEARRRFAHVLKDDKDNAAAQQAAALLTPKS
jgi:tetratricopeptide (TPR) repeat protein